MVYNKQIIIPNLKPEYGDVCTGSQKKFVNQPHQPDYIMILGISTLPNYSWLPGQSKKSSYEYIIKKMDFSSQLFYFRARDERSLHFTNKGR